MPVEKENPTCPFCDGKNVELYSSFGTAQLVRQYYCLNCKTVFESIRWKGSISTDRPHEHSDLNG
ncbi:hypothetical protein ACPOM7_11350 [Peribacillus castrilensis]|uniref:PaaD zinc beta ribbon domain-containing protein n=1 Tax=Peribacillus simplex TaxID=1478 RepID=A0AAN2PIB8_9BACI|nr:hypothetical protein CQ056_10815 [Peribacillus simplex]CEG32120.1 hypothetical protein BN1180_02277 [Peribacillus simplex]